MAKPIWTGSLAFGLLNIPIRLMSGESRTDIHFRMLDSRNNAPVRYERVNAETGEEVPWKDIVKAYEFSDDNYVILEPSDLERAASENHETIELEAFVDGDQVPPAYFERPYVLVPGNKAEKGYVLLREVLRKTGRVGIGRVVIRTREYLAMVTPQQDALMLILLRFPQELVKPSEYSIPEGDAKDWHVSAKELEMAEALLESMSEDWDPSQYKDEFRKRLVDIINERIKQKGATTHVGEEEPEEEAEPSTNVVDFMALLQKSLEKKGETLGGKGGAGRTGTRRTKEAGKPSRARGAKRG